MSVSQSCPNRVGNKLLAILPGEEYKRLLPHLELVYLFSAQLLYQTNEPIEYAYFPLNGVCSLLNIMKNGEGMEAATVGKEGMLGVPLLLGTTQMPMQAIAQIPGDALRIKANVFQREVFWGCPLHTLLLRYTHTLMNQFAQTSACNRVHLVEQRCCRWLLMTRDRVESNELPLTQEFLSLMLGVRRSRRSEVVANLEKAGLIRYQRGRITLLDLQGLEASACECYQLLKQEFDRLFSRKFPFRGTSGWLEPLPRDHFPILA